MSNGPTTTPKAGIMADYVFNHNRRIEGARRSRRPRHTVVMVRVGERWAAVRGDGVIVATAAVTA